MAINELKTLGASAVSLVVHWHQLDVKSNQLAPGSLTPSDADLVAAIAVAKERGLRVILFPIVWVEKRAKGKWRGTLVPTERNAWWLSYERFILHYAHIADATDVDWLSVGSELGTTETWRDRWYHLISGVERACDAALIYSANWDHFAHVSFWRRLDAVGINGYMPLTRRRDASVAELTTAWRRHAAALTTAVAALGKPLILTEVGYLSRDGGAVEPWNYGRRSRVDLEEQRRAYAAFSRVWRGRTALAAVWFWNWNGVGGTSDRDYTPRGKPAAQVVRSFFATRRPRR